MTADRPRTLVIACGALIRELQVLIAQAGRGDIDLKAIPATYHNRPEKITPAVARRIAWARSRYDRVFVAFGDCGTGGELDKLLAREGVERLPGAHCYAFYSGVEAFSARGDADMTSFFLTDFLVRHFQSLVIRGLGLDRHPELLPMYFGNYRKVVYLSQLPTRELIAGAEAAARRLGLAFEHRPVGFGDLARVLTV
jgi:hypothetical protein